MSNVIIKEEKNFLKEIVLCLNLSTNILQYKNTTNINAFVIPFLNILFFFLLRLNIICEDQTYLYSYCFTARSSTYIDIRSRISIHLIFNSIVQRSSTWVPVFPEEELQEELKVELQVTFFF